MANVPLFTILLLIGLPLCVYAQQWHSRISVESRGGFSSNSYLNEYLSEWEPSLSAPYWMVAPRVQFSRYFGQNEFKASGGLYFQPYLASGYSNWRGGYGQLDFNRRWTRSLFTGIKSGFSQYHYSYARSMIWFEPYIRWNLKDNMEGRLQWNSSYRDYQNLQTDTSSNHYNRASLHYQWWPSYKWRLRAGVYGNIDQFNGGKEAFSGYVGSAYWLRNDLNVQLRAGFERYGFQSTSKRSVGPRCDVLKGCSTNNLVSISNRDRIYRIKLSGSYSLNARWTFSISSALMQWENNRSGTVDHAIDRSLSAGVTYSLVPDWGGREKVQVPSIEQKREEETLFKITYKGEGKLYLTGDFNDWNRPGIPLIKGPNHLYRTTLQLEKGLYEYKILVVKGGETEWLELDDATMMVEDGFGGLNGRMIIE